MRCERAVALAGAGSRLRISRLRRIVALKNNE